MSAEAKKLNGPAKSRHLGRANGRCGRSKGQHHTGSHCDWMPNDYQITYALSFVGTAHGYLDSSYGCEALRQGVAVCPFCWKLVRRTCVLGSRKRSNYQIVQRPIHYREGPRGTINR